MKLFPVTENRTGNFSYPSSAAAVVFGGHLSAQAAFGLTGNRPQSAPACSFLRYSQAYLRNHWEAEFIYELDFYKDSVPLNLVTQLTLTNI